MHARASHSICTRTSRTRYSTMGACYNVLISLQRARRVRKIVDAQRYIFMRTHCHIWGGEERVFRVHYASYARDSLHVWMFFRYKRNVISPFRILSSRCLSLFLPHNILRYPRHLQCHIYRARFIKSSKHVCFENVTREYISVATQRLTSLLSNKKV